MSSCRLPSPTCVRHAVGKQTLDINKNTRGQGTPKCYLSPLLHFLYLSGERGEGRSEQEEKYTGGMFPSMFCIYGGVEVRSRFDRERAEGEVR